MKPDDIPQWAWDEALAVEEAARKECQDNHLMAGWYGYPTVNGRLVLVEHIARALLEAALPHLSSPASEAADLEAVVKRATEWFDSLSPEEQAAHRAGQATSFARGMGPCEHGVLDFEACPDCRAKAALPSSAIAPTQAPQPTPDAPGCEWCSFTGLQADGETPCPCTDAGLTANAEFLRRAEAAEAEVEKLQAEVEFQCNRAKRAETLWKADINSWHKTEARLAEAVEVLRPFADTADHDIGSDEADSDTFRPMTNHNRAAKITVGDMRRAFNFLQSLSKGA